MNVSYLVTACWKPSYSVLGKRRESVGNTGLRAVNPLSLKSDQHQISPCNINAFCKTVSGHENYGHDHTTNLLDIFSTSPNYFRRK